MELISEDRDERVKSYIAKNRRRKQTNKQTKNNTALSVNIDEETV